MFWGFDPSVSVSFLTILVFSHFADFADSSELPFEGDPSGTPFDQAQSSSIFKKLQWLRLSVRVPSPVPVLP